MNSNSIVPLVVEGGGTQVVAHVGLHVLGSFADRLGLGDCLSAAFVPGGERLPVHDRGKVLTQAMLMLVGGGEACADIERLRAQPSLFGSVASDSRLYRTFRGVDADTLAYAKAAVELAAGAPGDVTSGLRQRNDSHPVVRLTQTCRSRRIIDEAAGPSAPGVRDKNESHD